MVSTTFSSLKIVIQHRPHNIIKRALHGTAEMANSGFCGGLSLTGNLSGSEHDFEPLVLKACGSLGLSV